MYGIAKAKLNIFRNSSGSLKTALILLFTILYLPHAFVLVEDLGLIVAYETDPGSHIAAIEEILRTYNMHSGYHSKYYGWTFFSINFIILVPIKVFCLLFGIESKFYLYNTVRLILFSIGLISLLAFYEILKKLFSGEILPFIGGLFYILCDVGYHFFYFIHPETTGLLFIFFALLCLLEFIDNSDEPRIYFYGLVFLVLASLSKQIFFFISLPILALFFHFYCVNEKSKYISFISSKKFLKILGYTIITAFGVLFVIHPYSVFQLRKFLVYQMELTSFFSGDHTVLVGELLERWKVALLSVPIIKLSLFLLPIGFIVGVVGYFKSTNPRSRYLLYIVNLFGLISLTCLIIFGNRLFILSSYVQPLYPFFIINLLCMVEFVRNLDLKRFKVLKFFVTIFFIYFVTITLSSSIYRNVPKIFDRLYYKDSVAYKTYEYIKNNIAPEDKLVYDHFVAVPESMKNACHYWHGCGTDYIDEYAPNYIMFNENFQINNKYYQPTERIKRYIVEKKLVFVEKLYVNDIAISIYRKL
jgi:hypothetical protein